MTTASGGRTTASRAPDGIRLRPATAADLPVCGAIWREALNDYMGRLNQPAIPPELGAIRRLHEHLLATDPDRFWVASDGPAATGEPIAFAAATRRDAVWFLSMLFVRPPYQRRGIGRALLARVLPEDTEDDASIATGTDSAQPISNALYASLGIVPRLPLLSLVGRPERPGALAGLPAGLRAVPFDEMAAGPPGGRGHQRLVEAVDRLDRSAAGFHHPEDHRFLRTDGRRGFLYLGPGGVPEGYGYTSESGRVGPVAVHDSALMPAVLGHLLTVVEPRGASALWVPGEAGQTVTMLLAAGLRLDGFPVLLCWDRPFADFERYLPISPGLL